MFKLFQNVFRLLGKLSVTPVTLFTPTVIVTIVQVGGLLDSCGRRRVRRGGALGTRAPPLPPPGKKVPLKNVQKRRESSAQICRQKKCARSAQIRQNENEKGREK